MQGIRFHFFAPANQELLSLSRVLDYTHTSRAWPVNSDTPEHIDVVTFLSATRSSVKNDLLPSAVWGEALIKVPFFHMATQISRNQYASGPAPNPTHIF